MTANDKGRVLLLFDLSIALKANNRRSNVVRRMLFESCDESIALRLAPPV